jgi:hypothetical protein
MLFHHLSDAIDFGFKLEFYPDTSPRHATIGL